MANVIYNLAEGYLLLAMSGSEIPEEIRSNFKIIKKGNIYCIVSVSQKAYQMIGFL